MANRSEGNIIHCAAEVFRTALWLGLTSFGGPIAHLGYFERAYVRQRHWLSSEEYVSLVATCQLLPGPTSSQVGFLIGLRRAGWLGAMAAWIGFTLPSALVMYVFGIYASRVDGPLLRVAVHGLLLSAAAVVAQAVWSMAKALCPDRERKLIAVAAAVLLLIHSSGAQQLLAMMLGAISGWLLCRKLPPATPSLRPGIPRRALMALGVFLLLLLALPVLAKLGAIHSPLAFGDIFYRAGAFVFGGGHVVLPLLRESLVPTGWVSDEMFLSGYGLAQAVPGPLFTIAAYLGAVSAPAQASTQWAAIGLIAIFLPGLLVAVAGQSLQSQLVHTRSAPAILAGVNASVVGILGAAAINPVFISAVRNGSDAIVAVGAFVLLQQWRVPPIVIVFLCVVASAILV